MLPETSVGDPWWALTVAAIYFGSVIAFGAAARLICARLMERHGVELADVHEQAGGDRGARDAYLLGLSRKDR
jgi:hypothetical protein